MKQDSIFSYVNCSNVKEMYVIRCGPNVMQLPKLENGMAHISDTGSFGQMTKI